MYSIKDIVDKINRYTYVKFNIQFLSEEENYI